MTSLLKARQDVIHLSVLTIQPIHNILDEPERGTTLSCLRGGGEMGKNYCRGLTTTTNDVSSVCDDVTQDQEDGWGSTSASYEWEGQ